MKILAVEFSSSRRSVAVVNSEACVLGEAEEMGGRRVIALVENALAQAKTEREEIELIAVGLGPGSYTGIRGALALAQGWQMGRQTRILGVSSAECLAAQTQEEGVQGVVNIIIDAQRDEFYLARFDLSHEARHVVESLRLAAAAEIGALEGKGRLLGPDAAARFPFASDLYPRAATLGRLALGRTDVSGDQLEPIYLRATAFKKAPPPRLTA